MVVERVEGRTLHGTMWIGVGGTGFKAVWNRDTGHAETVGDDKASVYADNLWAIHPDDLKQFQIDWTKPIRAGGSIGGYRNAVVLTTQFRLPGRHEDLVLIMPTQPGWDNERPLVRTQFNEPVPTPWGNNNGIAVKFENVPLEKVVVMANVTPENLSTKGDANVRLVFEGGELKDATVLK